MFECLTCREGIDLVLNSRVASVSRNLVTVVDKKNESSDIPFGACVWATGVAMHPLVKQLQVRTMCHMSLQYLKQACRCPSTIVGTAEI